MKNEAKSKSGTETKTATVALAEINAQIEALKIQKSSLAEPLKAKYVETRRELSAMETEIRSLDGNWRPEPMKPKAESKIAEVITAHGSPIGPATITSRRRAV